MPNLKIEIISIPRNLKSWSHEYPYIALQQSIEYAKTLTTMGKNHQLIWFYKEDKKIGYAFLITRRFLWLSLHAILRGPIWDNKITSKTKQQCITLLHKRLKTSHLFFISPLENLADNNYSRVMTGDSTAWLDLTLSPKTLRDNMDKKWRNALTKAEKSSLIIKQTTDDTALENLCQKENIQKKQQRYIRALPKKFEQTYRMSNGKESLLHLQSFSQDTLISEMLFLCHGKNATYHIGWTNDMGRQQNTHNLLLWNAIKILQKRGYHTLDLCGIDTINNPGIARFKIGSGAHIITYPGTYMPPLF